ncbi:permease [Nocardioides sp. IC4_145]|uniref:permease n=1 Tax=Nocardioides sp. IC4_145 TaxID=2714037 RepID=UPI00325B32AB
MSTPAQVETASSRPSARGWQPALVALLVVGGLLSQRWLGPIDDEALGTWCTMFVAVVVQSAPFLLAGVVLSALIATLLSARVLRRVVPANPVLAVPVAGIAGVGLPGCECAAVPIAGGLMRRGVAPAVALTFLLAAPAVNPVVLVSTAVAFPGEPRMVVARFLASLATAVLVGWWCLSRGRRLPIRLPRIGAEHPTRRFADSVRHDFLHASGFLVLGAMLAAAANTFVPRTVIETVAGQAVVGVLTLAVFAFVVALCSESDAFVAASLTAFSDTAKLAFLVVGPAMDVKLAAMEAGYFGGAFAARFVPVVVVTAVAMAAAVGCWLL